jgi:hypothetical protein
MPPAIDWRKSTQSGTDQECVEVAKVDRDSAE